MSKARPGSPVLLRALEQQDIARTLRWHNDRQLYQTLVGPFRWVSTNAEETWLASRSAYSDLEVSLAICLAGEDERHIGNIYLRNIDWRARNATVDVFIGDVADRGKGYGSAAIQLIAEHAFDDLGLHRLYLFVLASNEHARRAYEKVGFVIEGTLIDHAFKSGDYANVLVMGLVADAQKG